MTASIALRTSSALRNLLIWVFFVVVAAALKALLESIDATTQRASQLRKAFRSKEKDNYGQYEKVPQA